MIDIETGEYEVDEDDLQATKRALAKRPEAVLYGVRISNRIHLGRSYRNGTRMIRGIIHNHEAIVELEVSGLGQPTQQIEAVIDTGYNGYLTLPSHLVTSLQLPFVGHRRGTLADGSVARLDAYLATVVWHGQPKDVLISQAAGTPLIGMSLLQGSRLTMDVVDGGDVTIDELP